MKACLRNYAYDPQCEGERAEYAVLLIRHCARPKHLAQEVVEHLDRFKDGTGWDVAHVLRVCGLLNREGLVDARSAMFKFYRGLSNAWNEDGASYAMIDFFGLEGLVAVARANGKVFMKRSGAWETGGLMEYYNERYNTTEAEAILSSHAIKDRAIAAYLERAGEFKRREAGRPKAPERDLNYYRSLIGSRKGIMPIGPLRKPDRSVTNQLFSDFRDEQDRERSERLVTLLCTLKIHRGKEKLLKMIKRAKQPVLCRIARALSHFKDDQIRELAIKRIEAGRDVDDWLKLLEHNYREGDSRLLSALIVPKGPDALHATVGTIVKIYRRNAATECRRPLELLYGRTNCGLCRYDVVKLLADQKLLSARIIAEIEFDSDDDLRALHKKITRKGRS